VLAGEGRLRTVLADRRRAHRDERVQAPVRSASER
jgi:hypothetical protein